MCATLIDSCGPRVYIAMLLRQKGVPIFLELASPGASPTPLLLCETFGDGETLIFLKLCCVEGADDVFKPVYAGNGDERMPVYAFAQELVQPLLSAAAARQEVDPEKDYLEMMRVSVYGIGNGDPEGRDAGVCFKRTELVAARDVATLGVQRLKRPRADMENLDTKLPFGLGLATPGLPREGATDSEEDDRGAMPKEHAEKDGSDSEHSGVDLISDEEAYGNKDDSKRRRASMPPPPAPPKRRQTVKGPPPPASPPQGPPPRLRRRAPEIILHSCVPFGSPSCPHHSKVYRCRRPCA